MRHDGVDERVVEGRGVQIQQADTRSTRRARRRTRPTMGRGRPGRTRHAVGRAAVEAPRGQVLGHEDHLAHAVAELVDLGQHDVFGARPLQAPERRDGAEAAAPVAALGHLDVGPRRARRRDGAGSGGRRTGGPRRSTRRSVRVPSGRRPRVTGTPKPATRSTSGRAAASSVTVALGQASRHHQPGAGAAGGGELEDGVDRLLAGGLDEGAGVDHHQVGVLGRRRPARSRRARRVPASLSESTWFFGQPRVSNQ